MILSSARLTCDPRTGTLQRIRVDRASLALLVVGVASGVLALALIIGRGVTPLALVPALLATVVGARNLTKREAVIDHGEPGCTNETTPDTREA